MGRAYGIMLFGIVSNTLNSIAIQAAERNTTMSNVDKTDSSVASLAVGGVGVLLFPLIATTGLGDAVYFTVVLFSILLPIRQFARGQGLGVSCTMLLGFLIAQFAGGVIQALTDDSGQFAETISTADYAFAISYLFAVWGLALRVSETTGPARTIGAIDAAVLLTGLMLMGAQFLLFPTLTHAGYTNLPDFPSHLRVWYPISAYLVLAMLVWVSAASRPQSVSLLLLEAGFTTWAIAESAFHLTTHSMDVPAWWIQTLWLASYVLIGAGIAHPDKGRLAKGESTGADELPSRAGFLALALLSIPISMWAQERYENVAMHAVVIAGCTLLVFLIWLRFNLLYRYLRRFGEVLREISETDPVSGAWNRRYFNEVMQDALNELHPVALLVLRIDSNSTDAPRSAQERLLTAAARALGRAGSAADPVARIGEREFALILRRPGPDERLLGLAWRALNELNELMHTELPETGERQGHAFIGIGLAPRDGTTVADLLDCVCQRLNEAIRSGYRVMAADHSDSGADQVAGSGALIGLARSSSG